jgi:hypothetical protein
MPLAIPSATRCSFDRPRRQPFSNRYGTSLEFCPPPSITQRSLADRSPAEAGEPISTSHGLSFPTAHEGPEVHASRAMPDSLRSAHRVWLPSRRLTPSEPVPALFRAGGALGIFPFGASSTRKVSGTLPSGRTHVPFRQPLFPLASNGPDRLAAASGL